MPSVIRDKPAWPAETCPLILSAATTVSELYAGKHVKLEFERTRSRLEEMQSHDYLAAAHLP